MDARRTGARRGSGASWASQLLGVPLGLVLVLVLGLVDIGLAPDTALAGFLVAGPAIASVSASPRGVVAVGGVSLLVMGALASTDGLWGTRDLVFYLLADVLITAVSATAAAARWRISSEADRLAAIVESSADSVLSVSPEGTVTSWNAAAEQIHGWSVAEVLGRNLDFLLPPDRQEAMHDILGRALDGEAASIYLTPCVRKDRTSLDMAVSLAPIRSSAGRVTGVSWVGRDVTAAVTAAAAVEASRARKSAVLDGALDALITMDHTGTVIEINRATTAIFGWTEADMVGAELAERLVPPESRAAHRDGIAAYLRGGESPLVGARLELTALHKNGTRVPVEVTITRVQLPGDPVFSGYLRDLSARRAAEEEAGQLRDRLRQAERLDSLGQLAGSIAHDFNNQLAVMLNYATLAHDELPPGQARDDVDSIAAAAERAAGLTRQLLTFSQGDRARTGVADLAAVVGQVCEVLARTLPATITVECRLGHDLWPVRCDATRLEQVLVNLAINARDAMPRGGTLRVETANHQVDGVVHDDPVPLSAGRYLRLTVTDTGEGMSREVRERAFDPFFTTKAAGGGTGLGLATVYGIARQTGGEVSIDSGPGRGTRVQLLLPAAEHPDEVAARSHQLQTSPPDLTRRVLLVEDEEMLREALERLLTGAGFQVQSAGTGEQALALLVHELPHLLVSDVTLPGLSGPELAMRLRERSPGLPVLLMSGYAEHALPAALTGAVSVLGKPFSVASLLTEVQELLGGSAEVSAY